MKILNETQLNQNEPEKEGDMDDAKKKLIEKAEKLYGEISPCVNKTMDECFREEPEGNLTLWFNTGDNSTHMVALDKEE